MATTPYHHKPPLPPPTHVPPVPDGPAALELDAPPQRVLCAVELARQLVRAGEGEPGLWAVPSSAEADEGREERLGAVAGGEAVEQR